MEDIFIGFWWIWVCIFFSGYAITYAIAHLLSKNKRWGGFITTKVYPLLPWAYVFATTCFWVFILYKGNLVFIYKRQEHHILGQLLTVWTLLALLFWIPFFRKKNFLILFHSIPFLLLPFVFLGRNLLRDGIFERDDILNLFRIYAAGSAVYVAVILLLLLGKFVFLRLIPPEHHAV